MTSNISNLPLQELFGNQVSVRMYIQTPDLKNSSASNLLFASNTVGFLVSPEGFVRCDLFLPCWSFSVKCNHAQRMLDTSVKALLPELRRITVAILWAMFLR